MENLESYQNTPEYTEAQKKWNEKGFLGVTAKDHEAIYSTPDEILLQNPGKTLAELMSDEEIRDYVLETRRVISENENVVHSNPESWKKYNEDLKMNLEVTIRYLQSIGRLPDGIC